MLNTYLEDTFGKRYLIRQQHQLTTRDRHIKALRFSDALQAKQFLLRLRTPVSYWNKLLTKLPSSKPATSVQVEKDIAEMLYRQQLHVFELTHLAVTGNNTQTNRIEQANGDRYTFSHASSLLTAQTLNPVEFRSAEEIEKVINETGADKKQLSQIAQQLNLAVPASNTQADNMSAIVASVLAGATVITLQKKLSAPPKPTAINDVSVVTDKPVDLGADSTISVKQSAANDPMSNINQKSQAEALASAAAAGAPFCEECAKAK